MNKKELISNPDRLPPYITLAVAYSSLNNIEEANKAVEEILRIDPKYTLGYYAKLLLLPF